MKANEMMTLTKIKIATDDNKWNERRKKLLNTCNLVECLNRGAPKRS